MKAPLQFSRRDFLKLSASGALGLFLAESGLERALAAAPASHGRVLMSGLFMYDAPDFGSKQHKAFGKDQVVPISEVTEGEPGNPFNTTWYRIGIEGYTYSGWLQPVETNYNHPFFEVGGGQVGEITVPYSLPRLYPDTRARKFYRLYYQTTHWVKGISVNREEKSIWYEAYDFYLHYSYYIPAYDLRIVPDEELSPLSPQVPEALKSIQVDLATQTVTAFEAETPVLISRCSSGAGNTKTPLGEFRTFHKGPSVHMTNEGDDEAGIYDLPGVPWVSFFTGTGIAFHGTYWHNDYGRPRSHGCVNLPSADAKFIYRWSSPAVPPGVEYLRQPGEGTSVQVRKSL
jgi:lipoprotein-anchoring transpeptidase ErfK/SrfK